MRRLLSALLLLLLASACAGPEDNPTTVHDLRVLGISFESPDLQADSCALDASNTSAFLTFAKPVTFTALIADPAGEGRDLEWELRACAWPGDRQCSSEVDSVSVKSGVTKAGELSFTFSPGALTLPRRKDESGNPQFLIQQVIEQDTYKGLGGIRMPFVLHLKAGGEEIYAEKLMVFSCKFFPEMKQNVTPVLPGLLLEGEEWTDAAPRELKGPGPFKLRPQDFADREEDYIVPSFELKPINLKESWKISWATTVGRMSAQETGGTDVDGTENRHNVEWVPTSKAEAGEVTIYAIVRDGRGGTSWLIRKLQYTP